MRVISLKDDGSADEIFWSFHQHLFGRPPASKRRFLERKAREADRLCLTQLRALSEDVLPPWLTSYKRDEGANSCQRIYSPLVTFWAFLSQTLDADGSYRRADRAFSSYAFIAACKASGVDVVMRLHQAHDPQVEKCKRLGDNDWHVTWIRPL